MALLRLTALLALTLAGLWQTAFAHNGMRDIGSTVKQLGRGGAFIATDADAGALNGNPAALAFLEEAEVYADVRLLLPIVDYEGLMKATGVKQHYLVPNLAYAAPIDSQSAWGLGVFSQTVIGAEMKDYDIARLGAPSGTKDRAGASVHYMTVTPGYARRVNDSTAIGLSVNYSSGATDDQSMDQFGGTTGYRLSNLGGSAISYRLGLLHKLDPKTTIGAYFKSRGHQSAKGGVLTTGPMAIVPNMTIEGVSVEGVDSPQEYGLGITRQIDRHFKLFSEYRFINWSTMRGNIRIVIPDYPAYEFPMEWDNQDVYVLGAEYDPGANGQTLWRCGINYANSPVPDKTLSPMFPLITEMHYTAGWERQINRDMRLSAAAIWAVENSQTSSEDSAYNASFGGGEQFTASASAWQFGLGLTWKLGKRHHKLSEAVEEEAGVDSAEGICVETAEDVCAAKELLKRSMKTI